MGCCWQRIIYTIDDITTEKSSEEWDGIDKKLCSVNDKTIKILYHDLMPINLIEDMSKNTNK